MVSMLRLRAAAQPVRPAEAWFLPGSDATQWLAEMERCGLAETSTRLFLVPGAAGDPTPAGVLVIPGKDCQPRQTPRGLPCGVAGERCFLPVDAVLWPPLTETELRQLCTFPVLFFHPALGVSGFDAGLRITDLLAMPSHRQENWNLAQPPSTQPARLAQIIFQQPPALDDIFGQESQDIGSQADEQMPPTPDEPKEDPLSKAARNARKFVGERLSELLHRLPHLGPRRNWLNKLEDWANRQAAGVSAQLERLRNKELHRLLHLLDSDPEKGLRHAIPLNQFAHRGRGPAGAKLTPHDVNFNLNELGGGAVDCWTISPDLQMELTRRYREIADRELKLGRYRRAAYIYAKLLGDIVSAANALKQGRHYREAALLYEERLGNPIAAARCLAEGGLFREAIERFEQHGCFLEVAELYERLGEKDRAAAALRRVVAQRIAAGDPLGAAALLETRLQAPQEALQVLAEGWPHSRQAAQCLSGQFNLLAKLGQHEDAMQRLKSLRENELPASYVEPLTRVLVEVATKYPDQAVRAHAADLTRVNVGLRLSHTAVGNDEAFQLVNALFQLAPQDRLLIRDGNRHLAERRARDRQIHARTVSIPVPRSALEPALVATFELPKPLQWIHARADGPWFFAAGVTPKHLTLLRGTWEAEFQSLSWPCPAVSAVQGLVVEPIHEPGRRQVIVAIAGHAGLKAQTFPPDLFISRACNAGTPAWLSAALYPFTVADSALWSVHIAAGKAVLSCYGLTGELLRTSDVTDLLLANAQRTPATRLCLTSCGRKPVLALGNRMVVVNGTEMAAVELPGQVVRLVPTLSHTRAGVVALLETGAVMHWLGTDDVSTVDIDVRWICASWIPAGKLVLISANEGRIVDLDSRGVYGLKRFNWKGRPPVAVTAAGEPNQFAVFSVDGRVAIFCVPERGG